MTDLAGLAAALAVTTIAFRGAHALRDRSALIAALPALALGSLSIAAFAVLFVGLRLSPLSLTLAFVCVLAYLVVITKLWQARADGSPSSTASCAETSPPLPGVVWVLVIITTLFASWTGWRWISAWPHGQADAVNIWTSRALLLARADGDIAERLSLMRGGHPDYPLFVPTTLAAQYGASGSESLLIPQATNVVLFVAVVAAAFVITRRLTDSLMGALAAMAVATNPLLTRWGFVQSSDVPLAYFLLLSAGAMATAWVDDRRPLYCPPLIGFFVGLVLWTKNEGMVMAAVLIGLAAVSNLVRRTAAADLLRRALFFALGIAPPLAALLLFRFVWGRQIVVPGFLAAGWLERFMDLDRWRTILSTGIYEAAVIGRMRVSAALVLALMVIVAALLAYRRRTVTPAAWFLLAVPAAMAPFYAAAYLLSPYALEWHVATSIDRLLLHLMPVLFVSTAVLVSPRARSDPDAFDAFPEEDRDPA